MNAAGTAEVIKDHFAEGAVGVGEVVGAAALVESSTTRELEGAHIYKKPAKTTPKINPHIMPPLASRRLM